MKEITMPKLSDTMTEGTVVTWHKAVGASVERGEVIAEVETDKATMELEAFASGVLREIRVEAGKTVAVGTVIGLIGEEGELPPAGKDETEPEEEAEPEKKEEPEEEEAPGAEAEPEKKAEPEQQEQAGEEGMAETEPEKEEAPGEVRAAPVVRRRAKELGIDLQAVTGSGPGGRVLLEDLATAAKEEHGAGGEEAPAKTRGHEASPGSAPSRDAASATPPEGQPLSRMRAAIARTVSESWRTIPHFSVTVDVRMDAAERFRDQHQQDGNQASLTALLIRAAALALDKFPRLNASFSESGTILHPEVNIAIVVRRDDGLLVPVLRDCTRLSLAATAERTVQLVERARHGKLSDTELTGGTFAISNLGMYGVDSFVALILPPMAAVLAVGSVRDGVVVAEGRPAVSRLMALTLSADHRLVDGVYAAEFLQDLKQLLEKPERLAERTSR